MTSIGKNVYFNDLDNIVNKCSGSFHSSIKMKPKDVTDSAFVGYNEEFNKKILNLKQVIISEFLRIKIF